MQGGVTREHDGVDKMSKKRKVCKVEGENGEPQWIPSLGKNACSSRCFGWKKREDVTDNGVR